MSALAKSCIRKRLDGGEIFVRDTWDPEQIRDAGYDLRIASDYLILPDGTRYWPEGPWDRRSCEEVFWIEPGEVAFVSTLERVCMPLDLAGNVAQRFSLSRQGLFVMGGLLVDPGYGMEADGNGDWRIRGSGERLHFQLANIGKEALRLEPGKTNIAGLQLLPLTGEASGTDVPTSDEMLASLFYHGASEPLAPLEFFPRVKKMATDITSLEERERDQRVKLDSTARSTDQLVIFGVFLLSITLLTVVLGGLIEAFSDGAAKDAAGRIAGTEFTFAGIIAALVVLGAVTGAIYLMARPLLAAEKRKAAAEGRRAEME